jgi:hypothetical protein
MRLDREPNHDQLHRGMMPREQSVPEDGLFHPFPAKCHTTLRTPLHLVKQYAAKFITA